MDFDHQYFIAPFSSLIEDRQHVREMWRQVDREYKNLYPEKVELHVPQPKYAELFNITVYRLNQHNIDRLDNIQTEK